MRRLRADAVAALFATRPGEGRPFSSRDLPELELTGLDPGAAAVLLARATETTLRPDTRAEILELAGGNPLALLELPRHRSDDRAEPVRLGKRLERAFAARVDALPEPTRRALVVAAATSTPDVDVLQRALEHEALTLQALEAAESAALVSLGGGVVDFRHPLVRSAVYHAANASERRRAHSALASALGDDDRGAWHLAAAATGPDETAAAALERFAERASKRSGFSATAAAYERAARLSDRSDARVRRLAAAADAAWLAGRTAHVLALIEEALAHVGDGDGRGDLLHMRGTIEHFVYGLRAHETLEEAARLLVDNDRPKACLSLVQAVGSSLVTGDVDRALVLTERACVIAEPEHPDQQLLTSFMRGAVLLMAGRPEEGLPYLERSARALTDSRLLAEEPRNLTWAALAAFWIGDVELIAESAERALAWAREHAAITTIAFAARLAARGHLIAGQWRTARATLAESLEAAEISGQKTQEVDTLATLAWLEAAQGRADECRAYVERGLDITGRFGIRWRNGLVSALVLLELGLGVEAGSPGVAVYRRAHAEHPLRDTPANSTIQDLIEALIRLGDRGAAEELLGPFEDEADRLGQSYPRAVSARCRALLADEDSYEERFEQALELHALDRNVFATARTRLAYGERLRRSGRRIEAREQLHEALTVFERLEAKPWTERARAELRATGERLRKRDAATGEQLTPQELQIAIVVAEGKTNREVGAQLFLSPKTIEWHLGNIYRKLGFRSRAELTRTLAGDEPEVNRLLE